MLFAFLMHSTRHLLIFTRFPVPGEAKTRLIPALGAEGAAELQRQMTEHTVAQARKTDAMIEIRYTGGSVAQMRDWLGDNLDYVDQGVGDLGDRMARAFEEHFEAGAERVIIVGCDCPSNPWKNIQTAFQALDPKRSESAFCTPKKKRPEGVWQHSGCVIGPATDGGYYLIGFCRAGSATPPPRTSKPFPVEMFENIEWGSENVLKQTLAAAPFAPLLLSELDDVDLPDDIPPRISVIIPTLNEAGHIFQCLEKVNEAFGVEVIIVDGGSTDGTKQIAQSFSQLINCERGRAAQQNMGAAAAAGEIFLFLHADTELPDNWDFVIRATLGFGRSPRLVVRLPPILNHDPANLRWNPHPFGSCLGRQKAAFL